MKIVSEYGTKLQYEPRSYDMACRVAHFVRERAGVDYFVVDGGRAMSEVVKVDAAKDRYALGVARRLVG